MRGKINEVIAVVEGVYFYIGRQYFFIQVVNLCLHSFDHFAGVFSFAHYYNAFYHIVLFIAAYLAQPGQCGYFHICYVFYQYGCTIHIVYNNISNFFRIIDKPHTAHHVSLRIIYNYIAPYINITFRRGGIYLQRSNVIGCELLWIYFYFIGFYLPGKAHYITYTWHAQ